MESNNAQVEEDKKEKKKSKKEKQEDTTGFVGNLTEHQAFILAEFKTYLKEHGLASHPRYDDVYLLRFLRARRFLLDKTIAMFTAFLKWREENKIDELIKGFVFEEERKVQEYYSHFYHGTDRQGRSVYIERLGIMNVEELFKYTTEERMVKHYCQMNELTLGLRFPVLSELNGRSTFQGFAIIDLAGFKLGMMNKRVYHLVKLASGISQDYYPEILGNMVVVNAPMVFSGVWAVCKGFVDEKTRAKVKIVKKEKSIKELEKYVDVEKLPEFLGGKCTCEEFGGCCYSNLGPWNDFEMVEPVGVRRKGA